MLRPRPAAAPVEGPVPTPPAALGDHQLRRLGEGGVVVLDGALGPRVWPRVRSGALLALGRGALRPAGVGAGATRSPAVRGDHIAWLDPDDPDPARAPFDPVMRAFEALRLELNARAFVGCSHVEVQLAVYGAGQGYARHVDQLHRGAGRVLTVVYYANDWAPDHGGELELWGARGAELVAPVADRLVIFPSASLEHGVRPVTGPPRVAVSGWLRRR